MNKRHRGRNRRPTQNPNRSFDSNGPDIKVRGSAKTVYDKYITLARDATSSGYRVKAENYLQHAEHYLRVVLDLQAKADAQAEQNRQAKPSNPERHKSSNGHDNDRAAKEAVAKPVEPEVSKVEPEASKAEPEVSKDTAEKKKPRSRRKKPDESAPAEQG